MDGFEPQSRELLDRIEDGARKLGLYMEQGAVVPPPGWDIEAQGTPPVLVVALDFMIGDIAWSKRVQDPEQAAVDKDFKGLQEDLEQSELDGMAERLMEQKRKLEEGG